ncbi:MAG: hypothetical protein MUF25_21480 [Pirellulaceae bacterium]|nr:hypothetical protein [Pirellulaceae bacterium]
MVISDVFRLRDDIQARDFQAAVKSSGPEATARKVPAAVFLSRTFPTNDLVRLLKVVETKFTRRENELGVIVIRSGMGGGKSHLITALDVILSNPGAAQEWAQKWPQVEFSPPPMPVRVIVRSLTEEPVENLWDCFFEGLGCPALKDDPTIARQGHPDTALCEQALAGMALMTSKHGTRNKWRTLPACDVTISRKLEAYATEKSDRYSSNGAKPGEGCVE